MNNEYNLKKEGSPSLKSVAQEVSYQEDIGDLIDNMYMVLEKEGGVGLAANQVGILKRVVVLSGGTAGKRAIINPVIVKRYGGKKSYYERCLSYPGKQAKKKRYKWVVVEGYDHNWGKITLTYSGLNSICIQHEIDHLDGKTIA